jgi:hypothetical protein
VHSALCQRRHSRSIRQVFITCPSSECPFTSGRCLLSSVPDLLWEDGSGKGELSVQRGEYILSTLVLSSPLSTYKGFVACKNCRCHNEVPQVCGHTRTLIFKKYRKSTKREHLLQIMFFFSVPVCAITASGVPGGTLVSMNSFSTLRR